ncbi:hypothetical protein NP233_g1050 [Leucocoprinus birnbaumii]|uniref:Potassium channel domain-containing protein n=1 Tax=Leucocoprinus birnbaumii TaxID=56174 RepID=A0AAD5YV73_9AGAR|nr:hypothetical protein NP233_g1050 [Leucocoprinus birnbaumii]
MNDLGLDDNIQNASEETSRHIHHPERHWHHLHHGQSLSALSDGSPRGELRERRRASTGLPMRHARSEPVQDDHLERHTSRRPPQLRVQSEDEELEEEEEYYQPTLWWFTSVAFPLIAGTFGPIANLFSICGLVQTWRVTKQSGARVGDPAWVLTLNIVSLVLALLANVLLLFNFAKRISYRMAQPFTIIFWYLSCILLLVPISVTHTTLLHQSSDYSLSQSYYYAFIACIVYFIISTLLLFNFLGAYRPFCAYAPSFAQLSTPQRTLMLQTIMFSAYLALGGGVFAAIEGWDFVDGVYWADYTLLTIGLGSDFPVTKVGGKMLLLPYAALGIVFVGLIVSSVRALVLERGKARITKRRLEKERERWEGIIDLTDHKQKGEDQQHGKDKRVKKRSGRDVKKFMKSSDKAKAKESHLKEKIHDAIESNHKLWRKREFELMRYIERSAQRTEGYIALGFSIFAFILVWVGGSLIFWAMEVNNDHWSYPTALYFAYTSITTIGYGDYYPTTASTRPFFVIWSLVAIPTVTVLIANMGETVLDGVKEGVVWLGRWSLLPERKDRGGQSEDESRQEKPVDPEKAEGGRLRNWVKRKRSARAKSTTSSQQPIHEATEDASTQTEPGQDSTQAEGTQTRDADTREGGTQPVLDETVEEHDDNLALTIRLTREISRVAKDASQVPPIRYAWTEWVRWLKLMDEAGESLGVVTSSMDAGKRPPLARLGEIAGKGSELGAGPSGSGESRAVTSPYEGGRRGDDLASVTSAVDDWRWTWLDDRGPLFSSDTETQWVLNKLCLLLEKVTQKEVDAGLASV